MGKMVYAPVVGRLDCGVFPSDPRGFWQEDGFGILSIFKRDWNTFGGMFVFLRPNNSSSLTVHLPECQT